MKDTVVSYESFVVLFLPGALHLPALVERGVEGLGRVAVLEGGPLAFVGPLEQVIVDLLTYDMGLLRCRRHRPSLSPSRR